MDQYYFIVYAWRRSGRTDWQFQNTVVRGEQPEKWLLRVNKESLVHTCVLLGYWPIDTDLGNELSGKLLG